MYSSAKSPIGMFDTLTIPNDLGLIVEKNRKLLRRRIKQLTTKIKIMSEKVGFIKI